MINLLKLEDLCPNSCEELEMLKNYIDGMSSKTWQQHTKIKITKAYGNYNNYKNY